MSQVPPPPSPALPQPKAITEFLLYRIYRLLSVGGGMTLRICEGEFGVTRREWHVLAVVAVNGLVTSTQLALHTNLDRPAASKAITSLVRKKLLSRTARPGDARYSELSLTLQGSDLYQRMFPRLSAVSMRLLEPLTQTEVAQLDSFLERMQQHANLITAEGDLPATHRRGKSMGRSSPRR